jgi:hypothetical protein
MGEEASICGIIRDARFLEKVLLFFMTCGMFTGAMSLSMAAKREWNEEQSSSHLKLGQCQISVITFGKERSQLMYKCSERQVNVTDIAMCEARSCLLP